MPDTKTHQLLRKGPLRALQHRNYAMYAPFSFLSSNGVWIQRIGIQWLVWQLTGSYAWLGTIVLCEALAVILVMPYAGVIIDQVDRALVARITRAILSLCALSLGLLTYFDYISLPILIGIVMIAGAADGFWTPTRLSIIPNLVPKHAIPAVISMEATSFHVSQSIGPAIAGIIIVNFGVSTAFFVNTVLYSSVSIALFLVEIRKITLPTTKEPFLTRIADAARYLRGTPSMIYLLTFTAIGSFCIRPYREFFAGFSDEIFLQGAEGLAMLATASGVGSVVAALLVGNRETLNGLTQLVFRFSFLSVVSVLVFSQSPTFIIALLGSASLGFALTGLGISSQILLQNAVDDEKRGRVMSLWGLQMRAVPSIGGFAIGSLASVWDIRWAFLTFGVLFLIYILLIALPKRSTIADLET